jgi:hypothetical protein
MDSAKLILAVVISASLGVGFDFVVNGVLKIIWIGIYGAVYLTIGATLYDYILSNRRSFGLAVTMTVAFLAGTALGHIVFQGKTDARVYSMNLVSSNPIVLQSPEFSDGLFVSSDTLQTELAAHGSRGDFPVTIKVVKSYGCIQSFNVTSVAGVDVISDPKASWVWRPVPGAAAGGVARAGMEEENLRLPWCRIKWF